MNNRPKRFSNLNPTISEAQCPLGWDFVCGKCYQVIVGYHFRFNSVLPIPRILQYFDANMVNGNTAATNCMGLCPMCHLPRLYSQQQGADLYNYREQFHDNLLMHKLIWNIRFLNCVFFFILRH